MRNTITFNKDFEGEKHKVFTKSFQYRIPNTTIKAEHLKFDIYIEGLLENPKNSEGFYSSGRYYLHDKGYPVIDWIGEIEVNGKKARGMKVPDEVVDKFQEILKRSKEELKLVKDIAEEIEEDNRFDTKSTKYLLGTIRNIELNGILNGWEGANELTKQAKGNVEKIGSYNMYGNLTGSGKVDIFKLSTDSTIQYSSELCYRTGIDNYNIESYIFDKKPEKKDIKIARVIEDIYTKTRRKELNQKFECWECGSKIHWTEIRTPYEREKGILAKFEKWQDECCCS